MGSISRRTALAADALGGTALQQCIVGAERVRDRGLHDRQVVEFVDHGNVDIHGTGLMN